VSRDDRTVRRIVIVGGGTAGWITAAGIASIIPAHEIAVELVESEAIGIVGVGEATLPHLRGFNRRIGVDEAAFMKATQATFKLGIEFVNWAGAGDSYIHPFGQHGLTNSGIEFHQFWRKLADEPETGAIGAYSLPIVAARQARFAMPTTDPRLLTSTYRYAYHFDATLYAPFLRQHSESRGVTRTEGRVVGVNRNHATGDIESITLESGQTIAGDLFIDCTGFRGLLIEEALETGYEDWTHWLPCDRAVTAQSRTQGPLLTHTRATAEASGWRWRIPLQHRLGNGHVYSSEFMDDDTAARILLENIEGQQLTEARTIRFTTGKRRKTWNRNCIAIGLAGGFLEPLESTSIYLIQVAARQLVDLLADNRTGPEDRAGYNHRLDTEFLRVRDFLILHYHATGRSDSDFWNYTRNMEIPGSLADRIAAFRANGEVRVYRDGLFQLHSWLALFLGQGVIPETWDQRVDEFDSGEIRRQLTQIRQAINTAAAAMGDHAAFIQEYCRAQMPDTDGPV
jgi:tryptophan halogenase